MNRKEVKLIFKRSELLYDVSNYCFVVGDIMPEAAEHSRHQVLDITEEGNVDRVTRVLNLAYRECVEHLYPYTKEAVTANSVFDDILQSPEEYTMSLSVPSDFSVTTLDLLEHLIHDFLVCRVLADWLSITFPQGAERWESNALTLKEKMRTSLVSRRGIVKRKLKPW